VPGPFHNWAPVSYRAAYTWEPIRNCSTACTPPHDPAIASIFSINPNLPVPRRAHL
jgi:hypothetical protein